MAADISSHFYCNPNKFRNDLYYENINHYNIEVLICVIDISYYYENSFLMVNGI